MRKIKYCQRLPSRTMKEGLTARLSRLQAKTDQTETNLGQDLGDY